MGDSYNIPGKKCDVGTIEAAGGDTWKAFCDCNFLKPIVVDRYFIDGIPVFLPMVTNEQLFKLVQTRVNGDMRRVRVETKTELVTTDDWNKCMSKFCGLISGCWNPAKNGWDPFNVHPGIFGAPWTEFGASVRGIQKADAGFFYMVGQLTSIDLNDYKPLALWQTYWNNPAKYALLMLKFALFVPGGAIAVAFANVVPGAPPGPILPLAMLQVAAEKKDFAHEILEPMAKGTVKAILTAFEYLGTCGVGVNIPCGAGILVQRAAQDQIDTGEIDKMPDVGKAIISFLAKSGSKLVTTIMKAATGVVSTDVFAILATGFGAAANEVKDAGAKSVLKLLAMAADVGYAIANGIERQRPAIEIADDVAQKLLGFSPRVYFDLLKKSAASALDYVKSAQDVTGSTFEKANALINAVGNGLNEIGKVIDALNSAVGGGLKELSMTFQNAAMAIGGAQEASKQVNNQIAASLGLATTPNIAPVVPGTGPAVSTGRPAPGTAVIGGAYQTTTSYGSALIGAGVGAALGGPLGALIGAGVAIVAAPKTLVPVKSKLPTVAGLVKPDPTKVTKTIASTSTVGARINAGFGGLRVAAAYRR